MPPAAPASSSNPARVSARTSSGAFAACAIVNFYRTAGDR